MPDDDYVDPRLLRDIDPDLLRELDVPALQGAKVRLDGVALGLAAEGRAVALGYESLGDFTYVGRELGHCASSMVSGVRAAYLDEPVTAWMHARLVAESAIRIAWVAVGSDATDTSHRLNRLSERDKRLMLKAKSAMAASGAFILIETDIEPATAMDPAPESLRTMAEQVGWQPMYGMHRWASLVLHPGFGNYQPYKAIHGSEVVKLLYWAFSGLVVSAAAISAQMDPTAEQPDLVLARYLFAHAGDPGPSGEDADEASGG